MLTLLNIKVPYKQRQIIKSLSQREDITIMKADKGWGVVIMNKSKYLEKCLTLLKACVCYFHHIFLFSPSDSPSKTMKNAFYFI